MVIPIAVIYGDGIGPEIMDAVLEILRRAEVSLKIESVEAGEKAYKRHLVNGIDESSWNVLSNVRAILKSPIYTPSGGGYRSVNVSIRKRLELYANIRPITSCYPFIKKSKPNIDLTIVRENEEGAYTGVEYRRSHNVFESIRTITVFNSLRIAYYGFEYAKKFGRKKVDCFVKDNIMKMTDGCFSEMFHKISSYYPDIESKKYIVDIGLARLAAVPENFDIIVTTNLYGDIASDIVAEIAGSVGIAGSANIGDRCAMFEAVHGTAPDIAGQNIANPSGLLNAAIMMLAHIGYCEKADLIKNAWLKTIESGMHTMDIASDRTVKKLNTKEFAKAIIENLGNAPEVLKKSTYNSGSQEPMILEREKMSIVRFEERKIVGIDIGVVQDNNDNGDFKIDIIANKVQDVLRDFNLMLGVIFCKGLKIWPSNVEYSGLKDCCTLRIVNKDVGNIVSYNEIFDFVRKIPDIGFFVVRMDFLFTFDDKPGFAFSEQ